MPTQVYWDEDRDNVVRVVLGDKHDWSELYDVVKTLQEIDSTAKQTYHIVFELEGRVPQGNPIPHVKMMYNALKALQHVGYIINMVDRKSMFAVQILEIVFKTVGVMSNVIFAESLEKAYSRIASYQAAASE